MTSFHEDAKYRTEVDKSCDEACLHAAYCGRGDPHSQTTDPNGGATNFGAVLNYLTQYPVDHVPLAERGVLFPGTSYAMACHLMTDNGSHVTLLRASLCSEWGGFENQSKRMMLELVLLAGADTNDPDLEEFFGLSFFSGGSPVGYATYYPKPAIALCTSKPVERLQQWPSILESLLQAETVQEQYKIVRSAFIACCNTTQAVLEGLEQLETK